MSDPWLREWTEPITIVDGRVPGFDDVTHAWHDEEDHASDTWRIAGQTTVCRTAGCRDRGAGDYPEYLQLWRSNNGWDWAAGFTSIGNRFPAMPTGDGIANVPDFWKADQTDFGAAFLHFGSDAYWLGNYTRHGAAPGQTAFVPVTPQQELARGAAEGHGFFDKATRRFIWYGCVGGAPPPELGVPRWDGYLTVSRHVTVNWGPAPAGNFNGTVRQYPVAELTTLRRRLLFDSRDAWWPPRQQGGGVLVLLSAAGDCLDIELNVTWSGRNVPANFGSIGVFVLAPEAAPKQRLWRQEQPVVLDRRRHGPHVAIGGGGSGGVAANTVASWGPVTTRPGAGCNELALLNESSASFWIQIGSPASPWQDVGWCSPTLDATGASWQGPDPKWIGYQGRG